MDFEHVPVLFDEAVEALNIKQDGVYVDCTAGGGGHSAAIAAKLDTGRLIAIDRDPEAVETLIARLGKFKNTTVVNNNFTNLSAILAENDLTKVDGILADLGVSSHQLDKAQRGFSFHNDAPLDMRMSMQGVSAADLVNDLSQGALQKILYEYGEERYAPSISRAIVKARASKPIETTFELVDIIKTAIPAAARRQGGHPARRSFQALRIEVNGELSYLSDALDAMFESLTAGGRLAIITFHSLEDRIVKKKFATFALGCTCPPQFPICVCGKTPKGLLPFKAKKPSSEQIENNPRCRSARLRVIEKIGEEFSHGGL
ncbi:MAG TPA: 16S rRNA (cytosine(1402)-N(4))-methyltransferase RsmH [Clostridia bacterium]|nr:16S rRNA (cytosine(1402)-N(4))-methyltransferase RsmH [Clostridia bacterium]